MEHRRLQIEGMTCKACGATIKRRLQSLPDVSCVNMDWEAGTVEFLTPDSATEIGAERTVESLGYVITKRSPVEQPYGR